MPTQHIEEFAIGDMNSAVKTPLLSAFAKEKKEKKDD
jgi:hypothetical protein